MVDHNLEHHTITIIKHHVTAQTRLKTKHFAAPSFLGSFDSPIERSSQIFRMISFQEPKICQTDTTKINEFRQITLIDDVNVPIKIVALQSNDRFNG